MQKAGILITRLKCVTEEQSWWNGLVMYETLETQHSLLLGRLFLRASSAERLRSSRFFCYCRIVHRWLDGKVRKYYHGT